MFPVCTTENNGLCSRHDSRSIERVPGTILCKSSAWLSQSWLPASWLSGQLAPDLTPHAEERGSTCATLPRTRRRWTAGSTILCKPCARSPLRLANLHRSDIGYTPGCRTHWLWTLERARVREHAPLSKTGRWIQCRISMHDMVQNIQTTTVQRRGAISDGCREM